MKIAAILLLVLPAFSFPCRAQSGVYKHLGQDGQILYSDTEIKGAYPIDLPEITVLPASRHDPARSAIKNGATLPGQNEAIEIVDKKFNQEIKQVSVSEATTHRNSSDNDLSQHSDQDRVQQVIEEMALYEDSIEALEIELYNLGAGY